MQKNGLKGKKERQNVKVSRKGLENVQVFPED
jgi:hypothetical protein